MHSTTNPTLFIHSRASALASLRTHRRKTFLLSKHVVELNQPTPLPTTPPSVDDVLSSISNLSSQNTSLVTNTLAIIRLVVAHKVSQDQIDLLIPLLEQGILQHIIPLLTSQNISLVSSSLFILVNLSCIEGSSPFFLQSNIIPTSLSLLTNQLFQDDVLWLLNNIAAEDAVSRDYIFQFSSLLLSSFPLLTHSPSTTDKFVWVCSNFFRFLPSIPFSSLSPFVLTIASLMNHTDTRVVIDVLSAFSSLSQSKDIPDSVFADIIPTVISLARSDDVCVQNEAVAFLSSVASRSSLHHLFLTVVPTLFLFVDLDDGCDEEKETTNHNVNEMQETRETNVQDIVHNTILLSLSCIASLSSSSNTLLSNTIASHDHITSLVACVLLGDSSTQTEASWCLATLLCCASPLTLSSIVSVPNVLDALQTSLNVAINPSSETNKQLATVLLSAVERLLVLSGEIHPNAPQFLCSAMHESCLVSALEWIASDTSCPLDISIKAAEIISRFFDVGDEI